MRLLSTSLVPSLAIAMSGATALAQPAAGLPLPSTPVATPSTSDASRSPVLSTCSVHIARAPDEVRAVVERWLREEPHCVAALEVRIVPTDGKLYVLARDEQGRVHERVVPDATSAAVLIASWAADDAILPPGPVSAPVIATPPTSGPAAAPPPRVASATVPREPRVELSRPIEPPGVAPLVTPAPGVAPSYPRWIGAGGVLQVASTGANTGSEAYGGRADIDLWTLGTLGTLGTSGRWVIGAAATIVRARRSGYSSDASPTAMQSIEVSAVARLGLAARRGRWEVTPSIALGYMYTYADVFTNRFTSSASGVSAIGQVGLIISFRIDAHLAITAGSVATAYAQQFSASGVDLHDLTRYGDLMMLGGLRWAL